MAFTESRKKLFSVLLASSVAVSGNLACLAAEIDTVKAPVPLWQEQATAQANAKQAATTKPDKATDAAQPTAEAPVSRSVSNAELALSLGDDLSNDGDNKQVLKSPLLLAIAQPANATAQPASSYVLSGGASMSPDEALSKIDSLTKEILLKEIELERFNLNYTRNVAVQGRWKGWRYAGFQEVNAGMGLTGAIISTAYRGARLNDAAKVKPCIQESANYVPMIGSYIGAGAAAMEFGINGIHDIIARSHGYSPAESVRKVAGIKGDIDRMLAEREALEKIEGTSQTLSGQCEVDRVEGKVLSDMLNQGLQEFERFHVGARKTIAFQQTQFFFDFSKYITNSLGYQFAYLALHDHHRRYNGNAGVLFMTSGCLTMFGPIISRYVGKAVGELTEHNTHVSLGHSYKAEISTLEADLAQLDKLVKQTRISNAPEKALLREGHYEEHEKTYTDEIRASEKAKSKAVLTATQNIGAGMYVGGTKLASGILFTVVGFNHHYRAKSERANHVTNGNLFAASVIAIPSGAFSMLDTLRIQVTGEINRHKLAAKGMLPGQLVTKRLAQLDDMEKKLRALN